MNTETAQKISEFLQGTCLSGAEAADTFGVDEDELLEAVADVGEIERCMTCDWWVEIPEMTASNECSDCHEQSLDEESE